jgi:hypothetical protein
MPAALLSRRLLAHPPRQKRVVAGDRGRSENKMPRFYVALACVILAGCNSYSVRSIVPESVHAQTDFERFNIQFIDGPARLSIEVKDRKIDPKTILPEAGSIFLISSKGLFYPLRYSPSLKTFNGSSSIQTLERATANQDAPWVGFNWDVLQPTPSTQQVGNLPDGKYTLVVLFADKSGRYSFTSSFTIEARSRPIPKMYQ